MNAAAEKEPVFGTDEGEGLNVGRKNEFLEGKMGQTKGNVGCPEGENIASERDRLRAMEMAGQLECGGTSNVEVDSGGSSQCDTRQKTGKDGQTERKARCRAPAPTGENDLKSDTQGETGETGRMEREPGSGGDAPAEASCMGTVSAGKNDLKSDTRREQGQTGQVEREPGCRGSPSAELRNRGTVPAGKNDLKSDTRREIEEIGQVEREPGCRGSPPAELRNRGTVPAGENELKSDTRREQGQTGQLERELGCRGTAPAGENELKSDTRREQGKPGQLERELGCRGSPPAAVADAEEVLAALTRILRGEEEAKTSEVLRAAELLGKQYGLFGDREGAPTEAPKIVMDVPGRGEKK